MTTAIDDLRSDFNVSAEFPGPHQGDILWRDAAGDDVLWIMNNNTPTTIAPLPSVTPGWHVKAAAEFDTDVFGDLSADILWQNDNGALALWRMASGGTALSAAFALPNPGSSWHIVGDNDFNHDLIDDILWRNDNGALVIWNISDNISGTPFISSALAGTQNPGPAWHVVGTGDTNFDFKAGILWQNDNGGMALWENPTFGPSTFTFSTVAALPTVDPSWHAKGMADVSGDGLADVVFQNDNGAVVIWEMGGAQGTTVTSANLVNLNPGPAWHIVGMRDMNGDRHADILFQNDNGVAAVWEDYTPIGSGMATVLALPIIPNPNPNGHVWDLL